MIIVRFDVQIIHLLADRQIFAKSFFAEMFTWDYPNQYDCETIWY